jgi:hypothetical protein
MGATSNLSISRNFRREAIRKKNSLAAIRMNSDED